MLYLLEVCCDSTSKVQSVFVPDKDKQNLTRVNRLLPSFQISYAAIFRIAFFHSLGHCHVKDVLRAGMEAILGVAWFYASSMRILVLMKLASRWSKRFCYCVAALVYCRHREVGNPTNHSTADQTYHNHADDAYYLFPCLACLCEVRASLRWVFFFILVVLMSVVRWS